MDQNELNNFLSQGQPHFEAIIRLGLYFDAILTHPDGLFSQIILIIFNYYNFFKLT